MIKKYLLLLVSVITLLSCGGGSKSRAEIQREIDDLHTRISNLEYDIPRVKRDIANGINPETTTPQYLQKLESNLQDYRIQLDELNRQLVNAK